MLIVDGEWITNNYEERIQEAVMRPKHKKWFLSKYAKSRHIKTKTIDDYNSIHWRGIGNARRRLNEADNTRLTKYLNGWLNTGRQKGHHGKEPRCPCCGTHEETQLHIFQCSSDTSTQARASAFKLLEKYYNHHKVPPLVYVPFVRLCRMACDGAPEDSPISAHDSLSDAISSQRHLGHDFLLRGYLTKAWLPAMVQHDGKHPKQKLAHLHLGLWKVLFSAVWEN